VHSLCTTTVHSTAQHSSDNLPSYPPDNHHCSDGGRGVHTRNFYDVVNIIIIGNNGNIIIIIDIIMRCYYLHWINILVHKIFKVLLPRRCFQMCSTFWRTSGWFFNEENCQYDADHTQHWSHLQIQATALITLLLNVLVPQPFYGPFSGTTRVIRCQKITSGLYGARED